MSFLVRQCKHKNQDKKSMCLIYNDTFSHKMHLRRLNLFASYTLSRLGLKCVNKNGFYKRSNSWLSLLTTCFFLFVLNRFSIFVFFKSPIYINQIISQRLRIQNTFKEEQHYVKSIWNFINLDLLVQSVTTLSHFANFKVLKVLIILWIYCFLWTLFM